MRHWPQVLLALGCVVLFALPIRTPLNIYDEGLALVGGVRVYDGDIPFRDYWAIYPPGQSYAIATVFRVAGISVLSERIYDSLVRLALAGVIYFVASGLLGQSRMRWIPTVSIAALLAAATFYGYAVFPALLFAFASLALFIRAMQQSKTRWWLATGLSIGLTALFRIDTAAYVSAGIGLAMLLARLNHSADGSNSWRQLWQRGATLIIAALVVVVPIYGWLAWIGDARQMFENLLVFPATTFHDVRHLPYPTLWIDWLRWEQRTLWLAKIDWTVGEWLRFYLPIVTYSVATMFILVAVVRSIWRRTAILENYLYASALLLLGIGFFIQAMSRYDAIHALPTSLPTVLLICWLGWKSMRQHWWKPAFTLLPGILWLPAIAVYGLLPLLTVAGHAYRFPPTDCYSTLVRASCVPVSPDETRIVEALQRHASPQDALFVASATHDRIFVNDVSLYFLAGHPIPTRYHELHPGVVTTQPVQQEIINELQTKSVPWLFVVDWPNPNEPNDSAKSSGVTDLDEYIHNNYQPIEQFGIYQLWEKKP